MSRNKSKVTIGSLLLLIIIISIIYQILKWTVLNILGVLGLIAVIAGFYFVFSRKKYNLALYWPVFAIVNGFFLALFWFSFKEPLNTLAILFLCSFVYLLITTIVMLIQKNVMWKRYSGITTASLMLSIIFLSISPQIETAKSEKTVSKQETSKEASEENKNNDSKAVPTATAVNNAKEKQKLQNDEQEKFKIAQQQENLVKKFNLESATVARVVDGDTFELTDGRKVRLIGVNTPESTTRTEPYGKEASNYTKSKLEGKQIYLQKDVSETDRYGRLLRIVWLQVPTDDMNENEIRAKMFNANLVLNGYAEPSTYPPDVKYSEYFVKFAREAREQDKGLWAFGEYGTTKGDLDPKLSTNSIASSTPKSSSSNSSSNGNSNNSTRSNSNSSNNSSAPAASSGGTEYFANCTELTKVYPHGVPSSHPAYQSKMDRDKDGYACER